jgi:mono/diheme cytochrome c family protein
MRSLIWFLAGAIALVFVVCSAGLIFSKTRANGFSARAEPSVIERWVARQARAMAAPAGARDRTNPIGDSPEVLAEARAHWADHCAVCHANNGSGDTEMGKHMYPPKRR